MAYSFPDCYPDFDPETKIIVNLIGIATNFKPSNLHVTDRFPYPALPGHIRVRFIRGTTLMFGFLMDRRWAAVKSTITIGNAVHNNEVYIRTILSDEDPEIPLINTMNEYENATSDPVEYDMDYLSYFDVDILDVRSGRQWVCPMNFNPDICEIVVYVGIDHIQVDYPTPRQGRIRLNREGNVNNSNGFMGVFPVRGRMC
jgi:hypothetical protein